MFSADVAAKDILTARLFEEPLIPVGMTDPADTAALSVALTSYAARGTPDDFSSLTRFVEAHPQSAWNAALLFNLGLKYYHAGYYSKTFDAWTQAWKLAYSTTDAQGRALADRAVGELAFMYARVGRMDELGALLDSLGDRAFIGPATERIAGAREGLWTMQNRPEVAFRCGPLALHQIKMAMAPDHSGIDLIHACESSPQGLSLTQVADLAQQLDLNYQMAHREPGVAFVAPSVMHLRLDHYAALIREESGRYLLQDPTFGNDHWVTRAALESETSGYFLVPAGDLPPGWRTVEAAEGATVWGKGYTNHNDPGAHGPCDPRTPGSTACKPAQECRGMAVPSVHLMLVSLNIVDEPVGYAPPAGPAVQFTVRYNQRDAFQPGNFTYSNLGPKWTFDWLSYITDDPTNPLANADYYMMGGGTRTFTGFDNATQVYAFQQLDQTRLTRKSPTSFEMLSADGTRRIFGQPDGAASFPRKVFLTQLIDPSGNAVTLDYDPTPGLELRLVSIADAIGQVTKLEYTHPDDVFKIMRVTDPFGRSATFDYDGQGRLIRITDVIGISSEFGYEADDFITRLTTPYGDTTFRKEIAPGNTRLLEIVHPDGSQERVEYNQSTELGVRASDPPQSVPRGMAATNDFLVFRNTFYWDRKAFAEAYPDYTRARIYHWLHTADGARTAGILESVKEPLEGRVWYDYPGQANSIYAGRSSKPLHVGRVLDDGSTQLYTYEHNAFGNVTKAVDPVGRTFSYVYAENGIDLLEVRQTRAGQKEVLSRTIYDDRHLPLTVTDAAGQTTSYTYNARGQVLTRTNARNETTTYHYNADGYLISEDGPLPGTGDTSHWTYDAFGRVRTRTDESGYALNFDYDELDRPVKITYPDGTFDEYTHTRLDHTLMRDRAGRETAFEYDSLRQMIKRTDPLGRITLFEWCKCGDLRRIIDPMGRATTWRHDVQGRVASKEYADGSKITYRYEDSTSRLRQRIDEKLQVTQYNYNRDDTVSQISYTNCAVPTPSVAFTYDPDHRRLKAMADGTGTTHYRYVPITPVSALGAGQLASVDGPLLDDTITFGYDELGRRVSTAINGVASSVTYDAAGRIATSTNALGVFTNTYDGDSFRTTAQSYPNGQIVEFGYADNLQDQHLQRITHRLGDTPISEFLCGHDVPTGQITTWSQQAGTEPPSTYALGYDPVDQLTTAAMSEAGDVVRTFGYSYDPAGNRLTEQVDATTRQFSYNALNQLTSAEGDTGPATTYQWDAEQRLTVIISGEEEIHLTYDGLGRCIHIRQVSGGLEASDRRFVWCDNEICEERGPDGRVAKRYFPEGVKVEAGPVAGAYFYACDHLGSIRELTDSEGNVRARYGYDLFGRPVLLAGDVLADFGFAGMFWLPEWRLALTRFRAYNPDAGRWLSRDPLPNAELEEGPNLFCYVGNDPVNRVDPLGLNQGQADGRTAQEAKRRALEDCRSSCPPNSKFEYVSTDCWKGGVYPGGYTCIVYCRCKEPSQPIACAPQPGGDQGAA